MQVTAIKTVSSRVKYSNAADTTRTYDITAEVQLRDGQVEVTDNGQVLKDGAQIANFNGNDNWFSINYQSVPSTEQAAILAEVNDFIAAVKAAQDSTDNINA